MNLYSKIAIYAVIFGAFLAVSACKQDASKKDETVSEVSTPTITNPATKTDITKTKATDKAERTSEGDSIESVPAKFDSVTIGELKSNKVGLPSKTTQEQWKKHGLGDAKLSQKPLPDQAIDIPEVPNALPETPEKRDVNVGKVEPSKNKTSARKPVVFYTDSNCPTCKKALAWFDANNINVKTKNFSDSKETLDKECKRARANCFKAPVTVVGGQVIVGFNAETLDRATRN